MMKIKNMAVSLELLTDDDIIDYTRSDGKDNIIISHKDLDLSPNMPVPVPGGVYDVGIFGSPFLDRCICGFIKRQSHEPCPNCGARVFSKEEGLKRFARIELPFYYLNDLRFEIFKNLFDEIFEGVTIKLDFFGEDLKNDGYAGKGGKKLSIKVFDTCQFTYSKAKNQLTISEFITDESKCSYEGLLSIIEKNFPSHLTEFRKLINRYFLVLPAMMRPFSIQVKNGAKKMNTHKMSVWYGIVTAFCCVDDVKANPQNYNEVIKRFNTPGERVRYTALLRALLNAGKKQATSLLNTSKKNEAREIYSIRVENSARAPIIPDTELKVDEIGIPDYLAYEMCREGFINYLMEKLNFTKREAILSTRKEANTEEIRKLFKEYAEQQVVLVNRQPTLYEYGIYCCKLRVAEGSDAIKYPIQLCSPLNADFDGDTVSITLVPEQIKEDMYNKMSPRYNKYYKKSLQPIFTLDHEALNGLNAASTYVYDDENELKDPRYYYDNYSKLLQDVEVNEVIKYGTPITFNGKIGSVEYENKVTSYGRLRISKIIDADIDKLNLFKTPYEAFKAGSLKKLVLWLYQSDDFVEKLNELQKFSLKCVTKTGVVTFDFKTLYTDVDNKTYKKVKEISDSTELNDKQKLLLLTERYKEYEKEVESDFSADLKNELERAGRIKIASIMAINMPQLIVSGVDEKPIITKGSLLNGYSEKNYLVHAIENRSLGAIKHSGVKQYSGPTINLKYCWNGNN